MKWAIALIIFVANVANADNTSDLVGLGIHSEPAKLLGDSIGDGTLNYYGSPYTLKAATGAGTIDFESLTSATTVARFGRDNSGMESLIEMRNKQTLTGFSGDELGRGAIRLNDTLDSRQMELGFYEFGAGIFVNAPLLEIWSPIVSIRQLSGGTAAKLMVRDANDERNIALHHDGTDGIISTSDNAPSGGVSIRPNSNESWLFQQTSGNFQQNSSNGGSFLMPRLPTAGKRFLQGTSSLDTDVTSLGNDGPVNVNVVDGAKSGSAILAYDAGSGSVTSPGDFYFLKTRSTSTTGDANTTIQTGDSIGRLRFMAADGTAYREAALIRVSVTGTVGAGAMPGTMTFATTPSGSATPLDRWAVSAAGSISQDGTNGGNIVLTKASTSVRQPSATTISAAGASRTDCTALTTVFSNITTVGAGQGVCLWDGGTGTFTAVKNSGGNALLVYPHSAAATINGGGGGASVSIAVGAMALCQTVATDTWVCSEAPAA